METYKCLACEQMVVHGVKNVRVGKQALCRV